MLLAIIGASLYVIVLIPGAIDAQADYNRQVAESRCIINGDFDDSTEYSGRSRRMRGSDGRTDR